MKKIIIYCLLILIAVSPLFRGLYFNYETYLFFAAIALLSIIYFFIKMIKNESVRINSWFMVISLTFTAAAVLSYVNAVNPRENLENILHCLAFLFVFLILYDYFEGRKQHFISAAALPMIFAGFVSSAVGAIALTDTFAIWGITTRDGRIGSTFQYANTASIYFAICFLFVLMFVNSYKKVILQVLFAGMGNTIVFALFLTGSRGGYLVGFGAILLFVMLQPAGSRLKSIMNVICMLLPVFTILKAFNASTAAHDFFAAGKWLAVSFIFATGLTFLYSLFTKVILKNKPAPVPKGSGVVIAAGSIAVVILAYMFRDKLFGMFPPEISARLARFNINDRNILFRLDYDRDALKLIASNWLTGLGGGGWKALYQSVQDYFYTAAFVHNNYLQAFVESGILGFLSYLALIVSGLINAVYSWLKAKDGILKIRVAGVLCALFALAVHSAFDFDLSFISMSLLLWVMLAAVSVRLPEQPGTEEEYKIPLFMRNWVVAANRSMIKIFAIVVCAALFSVNALYFTGAYNEKEALEQMQLKNYKSSAVYYEEAYRLDPGNTEYSFALAKFYNYFANKSTGGNDREVWLERARKAAEKSVDGNRGYPAYMNTLIRIYLDSHMPLQALEYSEKLAANQKYNSEVYELLAQSYIAASDYYEKSGDTNKAKDLLKKCLEIDNNPYLRKSNINNPIKIMTLEQINSYKHSERLMELLKEAGNKYR